MAARRQREQRKRKELGTKYAFEGIVPSDLLPPVRPHHLSTVHSVKKSSMD
jgi:hypothetical protein